MEDRRQALDMKEKKRKELDDIEKQENAKYMAYIK